MHAIKLTPKMLAGLLWFEKHQPVSMFPCDGTAPTHIIRKRLKTMGWIEECGKDNSMRGWFAFTQYRVSEAGKEVLSRAPAQRSL